jgi:hypothetical protein
LINPSSPSQRHDEAWLDEAGCQRLAAAVLLQAIYESTDPDPDVYFLARKWLVGEGRIWAFLIGINPQAIHAWIQQGCPKNPSSKYEDQDVLYHELIDACAIIAEYERRHPWKDS